jgi:MFS family permease
VPARAPAGLTIGLLLAVTIGALESLAVLSVMPVVAADLDGLSLYGWVFGGFFLTSAVAIPITARVIDRSGLTLPFAAGLALFGGGLFVAGFAPTMLVLVGGRLLQGFGAGALNAVVYATVAIAYTPRERGRVLALLSTAWLVPAFVGPLLGSAIAVIAGWRWTFFSIAAFVPVVAALVLPVVRAHDASRVVAGVAAASWRRSLVPPREIGRAAILSMLAQMATTGVLTFAPLGMTEVRGQSSFDAGIVIGVCSVAWIGTAWVHQRVVDRVDLRDSIRFGLLAVTCVSIPLVAVLVPAVPFAVILLSWALVGVGCGVAFQAINLYVMGRAAPGTEGQVTSSVQLANTIGAAVGTTALGGLLNLARSTGLSLADALLWVFVACWLVQVAATQLAWGTRSTRVRDTQPVTAAG